MTDYLLVLAIWAAFPVLWLAWWDLRKMDRQIDRLRKMADDRRKEIDGADWWKGDGR